MRRSLRRLGVRRLALLLNVVMLLVLVLVLVVRHGTIVVEIRVVHVLVSCIPSLAAVLAPPPALAHILMILIGMVASMMDMRVDEHVNVSACIHTRTHRHTQHTHMHMHM